MISLTYSCDGCGWRSAILDEAQQHANDEEHVVLVQGSITAQMHVVGVKTKLDATELAKKKAREAEIMRRAKHLGYVRTK